MKEYKVWVQIEAHDDSEGAEEEYTNDEPEELGCFDAKDAADEYVQDIMRLSGENSMQDRLLGAIGILDTFDTMDAKIGAKIRKASELLGEAYGQLVRKSGRA